ncbi:protection of telomeres protein 1-like isoform X2 [Acropora muricata]|uniref:protection of telomeres protein 1-like isoform X2 n=1 Tax=Acropora muricata TaxID=159855 RepID=UPI0034E5E77D
MKVLKFFFKTAFYWTRVLTKVYPSFHTPRGWMKKVQIRDFIGENQPNPTSGAVNSTSVVSVFLRGSLVEHCFFLKERDLFMISGARIEKSAVVGHKFNIVASESEDLRIWVLQGPNTKASSVQFATVPKPDESSDSLGVKMVCDGESIRNEPPVKRCKLVLHPEAITYTRLADLKVNGVVNIYGVVKFFKSPFKTKGCDFVCSLSLVDPSFDNLDKSFKCVLFSKSKETLPLIKSVGDIVRFHRLAVSQYQGELQGKFLPDSSWIVFDCIGSDIPQVRSSSSKSYVLAEEEKDIIKELKEWSHRKETLNTKFALTSLRDLSTAQSFVNILCQIVSKGYTTNKAAMLELWDGSVPACQSILVEPIIEQNRVTSDELKHKARKRSVEVFLSPDHVSGDVARAVPGDFVCLRNVHIKEIKKERASTPSKMKKEQSRPFVSLEVHRGTICGRGVEILASDDPMVTSSAAVKFITEAEAEAEAADIVPEQQEVPESLTTHRERIPIIQSSKVSEKKQEHHDVNELRFENKLAANVESRALQTSCTITEHPCIPFTSLKDVKACKTVPNKFRCRVKALAHLPSDVRRFVRRSCQTCRYMLADEQSHSKFSDDGASARCNRCPRCNQDFILVYLFSLVIEDQSALVHVMVFDQDVVAFFPDLPSPQEFAQQISSHEALSEWMITMTRNPINSLGFVNQDPRGDKRPWLELCIVSYMPHGDKNRGKILYRVFDSTFVGEP